MRRDARLGEATARLAPDCTREQNSGGDLSAYTLTGDALEGLRVPTRFLGAEDGPVIPIEDCEGLRVPSDVRLEVTEFGGHCGFIKSRALDCYTDDVGLRFLNELD